MGTLIERALAWHASMPSWAAWRVRLGRCEIAGGALLEVVWDMVEWDCGRLESLIEEKWRKLGDGV